MVVLLVVSICQFSFAQDSEESNNSFTIQFAGSGARNLSAAYERILVSKTKYRLAQSIGYSPTFSPEDHTWFTEVNWIFGQNKHHFTTGVSYTVVIPKSNELLLYQETSNAIVFANVGYRLQEFKRDGITFNARLMPAYDIYEDYIVLWGGVSLGYSF